jgi:hypothetical protein
MVQIIVLLNMNLIHFMISFDLKLKIGVIRSELDQATHMIGVNPIETWI